MPWLCLQQNRQRWAWGQRSHGWHPGISVGVSFLVHLYLGQLQERAKVRRGRRHFHFSTNEPHCGNSRLVPSSLHRGPDPPVAFLRNHHRLGTCCNQGLGIIRWFMHSPWGWELSSPLFTEGEIEAGSSGRSRSLSSCRGSTHCPHPAARRINALQQVTWTPVSLSEVCPEMRKLRLQRAICVPQT